MEKKMKQKNVKTEFDGEIPQWVTWQRLGQRGQGKGAWCLSWGCLLASDLASVSPHSFYLALPTDTQIRRFNARFFLNADVTIQRIIRQTTSEPCVVVGSSKLWKWISIHGKRFITSVALSFPAISVWNGKETSKRKWRPDLAMLDKLVGGGYTSLKYPLW